VGTALNNITNKHEGKTIVIVCHGGVIEGTFLLFFGLSMLHFPRVLMSTRNTSITHWSKASFENVGIPPIWSLNQYNDAMHLRDLESSTHIPWQAISTKPTDDDKKPERVPGSPLHVVLFLRVGETLAVSLLHGKIQDLVAVVVVIA